MLDSASNGDAQLPRPLSGGLLLRRATIADTEALAAFNAEVHREPHMTGPDETVAEWVRDLMTGHPIFTAQDFTIVEDTRSGAIVSSLCLIDQTWQYAGIPFGVGRPELVGTHPDYRNRGLVRVQFDAIHAWSRQRGHLIQAITGIPYYYRQFGYEMAVNLGGSRSGFSGQVPRLREGESEPISIRPATHGDVGFIETLQEPVRAHSLLYCCRDSRLWRYEIDGRRPCNANRRELRIIESPSGEPVGLLIHGAKLYGKYCAATQLEITPHTSWLAVLPSIVRYLLATGVVYAQRDGEECLGFSLDLGADHPAYRAVPGWLPVTRPPYAWYLRLPNLAGFLHHIRTVLEARLAASVGRGFSGELNIGFYRDALRLAFESGCLVAVERAATREWNRTNCNFPGLAFAQLLFGYRSLEELRYALPDCTVDGDRTAALLSALFPKHPSVVWPVD